MAVAMTARMSAGMGSAGTAGEPGAGADAAAGALCGPSPHEMRADSRLNSWMNATHRSRPMYTTVMPSAVMTQASLCDMGGPHSGMLVCRFAGFASRFPASSSRALMIRNRVPAGLMMSSM